MGQGGAGLVQGSGDLGGGRGLGGCGGERGDGFGEAALGVEREAEVVMGQRLVVLERDRAAKGVLGG